MVNPPTFSEFTSTYPGGLGLSFLIFYEHCTTLKHLNNIAPIDYFLVGKILMRIPFLSQLLAITIPPFLLYNYYNNTNNNYYNNHHHQHHHIGISIDNNNINIINNNNNNNNNNNTYNYSYNYNYNYCYDIGMNCRTNVINEIINMFNANALLYIYFSLEILFLFYYQWRKKVLCKQKLKLEPFSTEEKVSMVHKIVDSVDIDQFLLGWTKSKTRNVQNIKRDNVKEFFASNFYMKHLPECSLEENLILEECVDIVQKKHRFKISEGYTEELPVYKHNMDELKTLHHPLIMYLLSYAGEFFCSAILTLRGFRRGHSGKITYWYYYSKSEHEHLQNPERYEEQQQEKERPLVLLHGIGIGLGPYLHFIEQLLGSGRRCSVILINLPWVSLRIDEEVVPMSELTHSINKIMQKHHITPGNPCVCIGHSYGSFILSALIKTHANMVAMPVFLDPVCFHLYLPNVVRNFLYEKPQWAQSVVHDWVRFFVASRDLFIVNALCRRFCWYSANLFAEEVPENSIVFLGGKDEISPNQQVRSSLSSRTDIEILFYEDMKHGEILTHADKLQKLVELVRRKEKEMNLVI